MTMREEYMTALVRGVGTALLAAVVMFFTLWTNTELAMRELISQTVLAGVVPLGAFLTMGAFDARRNDRR